MNDFASLGLKSPLLEAITAGGYQQPTPIQAKAIPAVLAGSDLLGIAQTGTGKTAAFALPIIQRLAANRVPAQRKSCHVLVLSPTRELATQIAETFRLFGKRMGLTVSVIFGGVGHGQQIKEMARGLDVIVATPGRLLDHLGERNLTLSGTSVLVLDEGDQMFDLGFLPSIRKIVAHLPARRQNLFFSATLAPEIEKLTRDVLRDPVKVAVAPAATTAELVNQRVIHVDAPRKRALLVELLKSKDLSRTLIFTRTKRGADRVAKHLEDASIKAAAIHGNKSQRQREAALDAFKRGKIGVLVATDIAARGIDVDQVSHVINFELPEVPETYVHRIGRTARNGASGEAISLCDGAERGLLREIERVIRQPIPAEDRRQDKMLEVTAVPARNPQRRGGGGGGGGDGRRGDAPRSNGPSRSSSGPSRGQAPRRSDDRRSEPRADDRRREEPVSTRPFGEWRPGDRRPVEPRADDRRRDDRRGGERSGPARPAHAAGADRRDGGRPAPAQHRKGPRPAAAGAARPDHGAVRKQKV